jgi:hypothetical protein
MASKMPLGGHNAANLQQEKYGSRRVKVAIALKLLSLMTARALMLNAFEPRP